MKYDKTTWRIGAIYRCMRRYNASKVWAIDRAVQSGLRFKLATSMVEMWLSNKHMLNHPDRKTYVHKRTINCAKTHDSRD